MTSDGTHDSVIIQHITSELKDITTYHAERKSTLIVDAAKLLADKYEDKSVICSKLQKEWSKLDISKSYISLQLPAEYKRSYSKPELPNETELSQYLTRLEDILLAHAKIYREFRRMALADDDVASAMKEEIMHVHYSHGIKERAAYIDSVMRDINSQMSNAGQFSELLEVIKILQSECHAINSLTDPREKYSTAWKLTLKLVFIFRSYGGVASMLSESKKHAAKWLSTVDHDPELSKIINNTAKCPSCGWNFATWLEKAKYAEKHMLRIPKIVRKTQK